MTNGSGCQKQLYFLFKQSTNLLYFEWSSFDSFRIGFLYFLLFLLPACQCCGLSLLDPDLVLLVRGTDPDLAPDPSISKQK
jgi:hypothetical protein